MKNKKLILLHRLIALALAALFLATPAFTQTRKPLAQMLSFERWIQLLQTNAARHPEVGVLWKNKDKRIASEIFLGGGVLRGLMHWHLEQLQTHSIEEVELMPLPSLNQLQLAGGKDLDIFAPASQQSYVEKKLKGISNLDFLNLEDLPGFIALGGPTLEKAGLNPYAIEDSLGGLHHYYEGRSVFHWTNEATLKAAQLENHDYSKTGEALRFIRFTHFNLPELKPDPRSVAQIRTIAGFEVPFLTGEERLAWIEICLEKLLTASNGNFAQALTLLHDYNLLSVLAEIRVYVPEDYARFIKQWVGANKASLSAHELTAMQKLIPSLRIAQAKKCGKELGAANASGK